MGLSVMLETEQGDTLGEVHDPKNLLHRLLPPHEDTSYQCLRFVNWYGDTVFNYLQMDVLVTELNRIDAATEDKDGKELIRSVENLARQCRDERHLYLKFYGD